MTELSGNRDLTPPPAPAGHAEIPEGLVLGIDVEELYFAFGEGHLVTFGKLLLGRSRWEVDRRKLERVRTALWKLPGGTELVQRIDDAFARFRAAENVLAGEAAILDESAALERLFDEIVRSVRLKLTDGAGPWYDLGVFLARVHFCLLMVENPPGERLADIHATYLLELRRVLPEVARAVVRLEADLVHRPVPVRLTRTLLILAKDVVTFRDGDCPPEWFRTAREHADAVFTAIGMLHAGTTMLLSYDHEIDTRSMTAAEPADPAEELVQEHERQSQALFGGKIAEAEAGLRALLRSTRHALGPCHPLVFLVRVDLSLALAALRRVPLCAELALDAADEAALDLGVRHPVTVQVVQRACVVLMLAGCAPEHIAALRARIDETGETS